MIAAVYARKSTEQTGVADEARSVTRQVEHATAYAARKGWTVDADLVFVDDGISGAEFAGRPGFVRLMNALKPRPPFGVLIMSEESRLGREQIETSYALKQIVQAGVRVFYYLEDRERTLDSPMDKMMLALTAFGDEMERERARSRTRDALERKARAGYVTGGRVFGYTNVDVIGPDGRRSHVERAINDAEAAVVLRIFTLASQGRAWLASRSCSTKNAPSPRDRSRAGPLDGPRRRCAKSSVASSTAASSSGRGRGSATNGAYTASTPGRKTNGSASRRRISRSSMRASGWRQRPE
jgi:DNA invertase Pin-like site-specific DNA recombinase